MNAMAPSGRIRNEANIVSALNDESFIPKGMIIDKPKVSYISGDDMDKLVKDANKTIAQFAREISSGEINKQPLYYDEQNTACKYCALKGMCNFKDTDKLEYRIPGKEAEDNE
jgi:ATP-dependent helicase/DNAse subunit B